MGVYASLQKVRVSNQSLMDQLPNSIINAVDTSGQRGDNAAALLMRCKKTACC